MLGRFGFFSASGKWLSFQASTECARSQKRACGSDPNQVSAAVARGRGREEGLKQVMWEDRVLLFRGFPESTCKVAPRPAPLSLFAGSCLPRLRLSFSQGER